MPNREAEEAKAHILSIYQRYQNADKILLKGFANTIRLNLQNFPSSGHFIIELIQNADDAGSSEFELNASDEQVEIKNNGQSFTQQDVESICNSASSNKSPEHNLGYLGVGFKSCFKVSTCPQIKSGVYSFKFDKNEIGNIDMPYELMPIWVDGETNTTGANFVLPLIKDEELKQIIANQFVSDVISGKLILFLNNLKEIKISSNINGKNIKKIIKKLADQSNENYTVYKTQEDGGSAVLSNRWLVFKKIYSVPQAVSNNEFTRQFKRDKVAKREVLIAFGIDDKNNLVLEKGSIHFGIYSFLPLRDLTTTFKFIIQGDFLTNPGRSDIQREAVWNSWMAECVYDLIVNVCIPEVLKNDQWKYNVCKIFHAEQSSSELINKKIIEPIKQYLNNSPVVFDYDGKLAKPEEVIDISYDVIKLIGVDEIINLYNKKPLNEKIEYDQIISNIQSGPNSVKEFMSNSTSSRLFEEKATEKNIKWFEEIYTRLNSLMQEENDLNEIRGIPFVLSNTFGLIRPQEASIVKDPDILASKLSAFKIVNLSLCKNDKILDFLENKLKIQTLTQDDVRVVNQYTPEQWNGLGEDEKISFIRYFKKHQEKITTNLSYITIPTKDGGWEKGEKLVYPGEYYPTYDIEKIISKGLLKTHVPKFVSPKLLESVTESKQEWQRFLREKLGCENDEFMKHIKEEIAIEATIIYEKSEKRNVEDPRPMGQNVFPGYDLKSTDSSGAIRFIEVKGSEKKSGFDIAVTTKEHAALYEAKATNETNYIYAVKDVLNNPEISILEGEAIKALTTRLLINENGREGWKNIRTAQINVLGLI